MRELVSFTPTADDAKYATRQAGLPDESSLPGLYDFLLQTLGAEKLADIRAKYSAKSPEEYERQREADKLAAQVQPVLASLTSEHPAVAYLIAALSSNSVAAATSAVLSLCSLVIDGEGSKPGVGLSAVGSADVERAIRDHRATMKSGGAHCRKTNYSFANPPPLTKQQHRLLVNAKAGKTLSDWAKAEGKTASWATKQRVTTIWGAVANGADLSPELLDFRRGVRAGPTNITREHTAIFTEVLRRAVAHLAPLVAEAHQKTAESAS